MNLRTSTMIAPRGDAGRFRIFSFGVLFLLAVLLAAPAFSQPNLFETKAGQAFVIDGETGSVLYSKDADKLIPPASLAKMMTMELVFHSLKQGRYTMKDTFQVSEHAWKTGGAKSGGSTMFAAIKSVVPIEALIQGVIVQSANDGAIILAEGMAGSEENFALLMTERARELGLTQSVFKNATGLPAEGQLVTMREFALLARHMWKEYPEYYKYYSQLEFTWNKIKQRNRNPLLEMDIGADGMKTGFTDESGYAIVGSIERGGKRVFAAMSGMATEKERAEESRKLLEWSLRTFQKTDLFDDGEVVGEAQVFGGASSTVALKAKGPVSVFVPIVNNDRLTARITYNGPLPAPVVEGKEVGTLKVWIGDTLTYETQLYTAENVGVGTLQQRSMDAISELLVGWMR